METIFASSNQYVSAIKIIRISGPKAKNIPEIFNFGKTKASKFQIRQLKVNKNIIDTIPVLWLPGPNTYTGEDMYELHIHGAISIEKKIYDILLKKKFMIADRGEFTKRAVLNGKIDLTQAEAINDVINSETEKQLELANKNLGGNLKRKLYNWRQQIIKLSSNIEALIDFSDEEIPTNLENFFLENLDILINDIKKELKFNNYSQSLKNGFIVSIVGAPNVGKSSLINRILNQDISIVTNIPGTTRDLIETKINLKGFPVYFIDTAGIRKTKSKIEIAGILKTKKIMKKSDIILNLSDKGKFSLPCILKKAKIINVSTKNDLNNLKYKYEDISTSAKRNKGIEKLLEIIYNELKNIEPNQPSALSNLRQINGAKSALKALVRIKSLSLTEETELIGEELRLSATSISNITTIVDIDEILDEIFNKFCIGK